MHKIEDIENKLMQTEVTDEVASLLVRAIIKLGYKSSDDITDFSSNKIMTKVTEIATDCVTIKEEVDSTINECRNILNSFLSDATNEKKFTSEDVAFVVGKFIIDLSHEVKIPEETNQEAYDKLMMEIENYVLEIINGEENIKKFTDECRVIMKQIFKIV